MYWKEKVIMAMALLKEGCEGNDWAGAPCSECPMYPNCFERELENATPNIWDIKIIHNKYIDN